MKSPDFEKRFMKDLDALIQKGAGPAPQDSPAEYAEMLAIAGSLAQADPSRLSRSRQPLRSRLLARASKELPKNSPGPRWAPGYRWSSRVGTVARWGLGATALLALGFGLFWVFSNLLPGQFPPDASGGGGPSPETTTTPQPGEGEITASLPPLSLDMPIEEIVARMTAPIWSVVWVDGVATETQVEGEPQTQFIQAWLDGSGRGRVINSDQIPGEPDSTFNPVPRWVWVSDGAAYALYDFLYAQFDPSSGQFGWSLSPLENAGTFMELFYPYYLVGRGGVFQAVSQEMVADRPALLVEWRPGANRPAQDRFWVDTATGLLLRRQSVLEDQLTVVKDLQIRSVVFDQPIPDALTGVGGVESARFSSGPQDVPLPATYLPIPTPAAPVAPTAPVVEITSTTVLITSNQAHPGSQDTGRGDAYLSQRVFGVEVDTLLRVDDACLAGQAAVCPGIRVDYPSLAWTPLFWSPDGSQAAFLDSNNSRLLLFDPLTGTWTTVVEPFPATAQVLSWSVDGGWIAATLQVNTNENTSLLTLVKADGSQVLQPIIDLEGTQIPLDWLDANRLLFMQYKDIAKGQVGQATNPVLYEYDLASNGWYPLPVQFGREVFKGYPVLSPDRTRLVFFSGEADGLAMLDLATGETSPLPLGGLNPLWSPDGQWLAVVQTVNSVYELHIQRLDGTEDKKVFEWAGYPVATWSLDGSGLLVEASPASDQPAAQLFWVSLIDGSIRELVLESEPGTYELRYPSFRP